MHTPYKSGRSAEAGWRKQVFLTMLIASALLIFALGIAAAFTNNSPQADFSNTAGSAASEVPSGVTWNSTSGIFLSIVPAPSSILPFVLGGLAVLLGFRRFSN